MHKAVETPCIPCLKINKKKPGSGNDDWISGMQKTHTSIVNNLEGVPQKNTRQGGTPLCAAVNLSLILQNLQQIK
jgi:hypothetical protein